MKRGLLVLGLVGLVGGLLGQSGLLTTIRRVIAAGIVLHENSGVGTNSISILPPTSLSADRTCVLQDGAAPIPDTCVGDGVDDTGAGGVSDGDKGDITVSGSGAVWDLDAGVVGPTELASTAVTPGSYTLMSGTVDADGRLTAASSGTPVAPGGNTTEVQFNNAGAFGGIGNLETDGTNPYLVPVTSHPAVSANGQKFYAYRPGSAGPTVPIFLPAEPAVPITPVPFSIDRMDRWRCISSPGFTSGSTNLTNFGIHFIITGTASSPNWASTNLATRSPHLVYTSAASTNTNAGLRSAGDYAWIGNAADTGGFLFKARAGVVTAQTGMRFAVGLFDTTAFAFTTGDPNAALDSVYFGCDAAQANLGICANDATSTAGCTDLGVNFPCETSGAHYDFWIWAEPNAGTTLSYAIQRLDTAQAASGTVPTSGGTPRNSVALSPQAFANTGTQASAVAFGFGEMCVVANL